MEGKETLGSGRAEEKRNSEGVEKVLIERDGRFELIDASDMQAIGNRTVTEPSVQEGPGGGAEGEGGRGGGDPGNAGVEEKPVIEDEGMPSSLAKEGSSDGQSSNSASDSSISSHSRDNLPVQPPDSTTTPPSSDRPAQSLDEPPAQRSDEPPVQRSEEAPTQRSDGPTTLLLDDPNASGSSCSIAAEPHGLETVTGHPDTPKPPQDTPSHATHSKDDDPSTHGAHTEAPPSTQPTSTPDKLKSGSRVRIVTAGHILAKSNVGLSSASTAYLGQSSRQPVKVNRAVSAPGIRARDEDNQARVRRERSEAAFAAWLARKNSELMERRKLGREKLQMSEEETKLKRQRNEAAYQAWLASKNKEQKTPEKLSKPPPTVSEEEKLAAFESWVRRKQRQRRKEKEIEEKRSTEQDEAAKKVPPDIVDRAYRE